MTKFVLVVLATTAATAHAGGKIEPGTSANPPRVADESNIYVELLHQGAKEGYGFRAKGSILNYSKSDRVRLDATQGGKVLASATCRVNLPFDNAWFGNFECQTTDKPIKAKGKVDFDLVYEDDATDKEYLTRRLSVNVQLWQGVTWQVTPDDLLAAAYADMQLENGEPRDQTVRFKMWFAAWNLQAGNSIMRCTVDGKSIPDMETDFQSRHEITADMIAKGDKRTTWHWFQYQVQPKQLYVGPRRDDWSKNDKVKEFRFLVDNPGAWNCQLRQGGRAIRELAFTVDDKGYIVSHAMQQGKGAIPLRKGIAMIEVRIPKDAMVDERIKPDQLKKSRGFGLAWPQDPSVKTVLASLPPAFENQKPKFVPKKGKRLNGIEHEPKRFIDEASTEASVWRSGDGYTLRVFAFATGKTATGDRFRVDVRQGKKVIGIGKCEWGDALTTKVSCKTDDKPLTAKGAIEADLIYEDDVDGNEYLIRTYKLNVMNPKVFGDPIWIAPPDDRLATAWMRPGATRDQELQMFFWFANEKFGELKMRCTTNGKQLPDIKVGSLDPPGNFVYEADVRRKQQGDVTEYYWKHLYANTDILTGPKESSTTLQTKDKVMWLIDNPGQWDCMVRNDGKAFRQFLFTVSKDGYVEPDPAQVDPAHPFLDKTVPIDVRFPKDAKLDTRIRGSAMKKSRGLGLPWPKPPAKPFPADSGLADPK